MDNHYLKHLNNSSIQMAGAATAAGAADDNNRQRELNDELSLGRTLINRGFPIITQDTWKN